MTEGQGSSSLSGRTRAELGIAGGFVGTCVMALVVLALSSLNVVQFSWFPMIGQIFGAPGLQSEAAMYGLGFSLAFGVIWGLVFAFAFKTYSVMKGMGIAGVEFVVMALVLSVISTPELQGTILSGTLSDALLVLVGLAVALATWGATVGYIGKRYLA